MGVSASDLPSGWMEQAEIDVLYRLATVGSSILEVGSWIGRSTCAMAAAVRDKGRTTRFDVVDFGITGLADWRRRFGTDPRNDKDPSLYREISVRGGIGGSLMQNLADRNLLQYVSMVSLGDIAEFKTTQRYDAVFVDALHDEREIAMNLPRIRSLLTQEFIFIGDDIVRDDTVAAVSGYLGDVAHWLSNEHHQYTKLGVFWTPGRAADAHRVIGL